MCFCNCNIKNITWLILLFVLRRFFMMSWCRVPTGLVPDRWCVCCYLWEWGQALVLVLLLLLFYVFFGRFPLVFCFDFLLSFFSVHWDELAGADIATALVTDRPRGCHIFMRVIPNINLDVVVVFFPVSPPPPRLVFVFFLFFFFYFCYESVLALQLCWSSIDFAITGECKTRLLAWVECAFKR